MSRKNKLQELKHANKIWAIGSLHSNIESLKSIKKYILLNFQRGDKLIFLGNMIGFRDKSKEIITELLSLRLKLMAKFNLNNEDIVGFTPNSEYEFLIDGERLYRIPINSISIKYERAGTEVEYNPSWL